jgi:hypothetical protein
MEVMDLNRIRDRVCGSGVHPETLGGRLKVTSDGKWSWSGALTPDGACRMVPRFPGPATVSTRNPVSRVCRRSLRLRR